jgi:hypothetical protein
LAQLTTALKRLPHKALGDIIAHMVTTPTLADLDLHAGELRLLKYVAWQDVPAYEVLGWVYLYPAPAHHERYAAMMEWPHREKPRMPG